MLCMKRFIISISNVNIQKEEEKKRNPIFWLCKTIIKTKNTFLSMVHHSNAICTVLIWFCYRFFSLFVVLCSHKLHIQKWNAIDWAHSIICWKLALMLFRSLFHSLKLSVLLLLFFIVICLIIRVNVCVLFNGFLI